MRIVRQTAHPAVAPLPASAEESTGEAAGRAGPSDATAELYAVRRRGHTVPKSLAQSGGSAVQFFENHARRLSHAEKVRTLLATTTSGTFTTRRSGSGWPFGTTIHVATESRCEGAPLVTFLPRPDEHLANIAADPRASLLVASVQGSGDRLATARASLLVRAAVTEKTPGAQEAFLAVHPGASYVSRDDFLCLKLKVESIRYIGGFGEMSWVDGDSFEAAEADPVAADAAQATAAVQHCNEDHADAVLAMAQALAGLREARKATMLSVDRYGFDVLGEMPDGLRRSRVEFPQRLDACAELRQAMVETTAKARALLEGPS